MNKNPSHAPNDTNKALSIMGAYFEAVSMLIHGNQLIKIATHLLKKY
jgi:hypothetical protein